MCDRGVWEGAGRGLLDGSVRQLAACAVRSGFLD